MQLEACDQPNFILIDTKKQTDAAPERSLGASSSQHVEPSTSVGPDTQPSTAGPSLSAGQGRQVGDVVMADATVGGVPAMGDAMQS